MLGESRHQKYVLSEKAFARGIGAYCRAQGQPRCVLYRHLFADCFIHERRKRHCSPCPRAAYGERKVLYRRQGAMMALPPLLINVAAHNTLPNCQRLSAHKMARLSHVRTPYQLVARA